MRISYLSLAVFIVGFACPSFCQNNSYFINPSFEDIPRQHRAPKGWFDCGYPDESPVDVHASGPDSEHAFFGVSEYAADGETFLGMVVRDNGTYEGVTTKLLEPLFADSAYKLTLLVNQSVTYKSISRTTNEVVNYDQPVLFEIWGGRAHCVMSSLIAEYNIDDKGFWTGLTFHFTPEQDIKFIGLYARQASNLDLNGNVLVDNICITKVDPVTLEERK